MANKQKRRKKIREAAEALEAEAREQDKARGIEMVKETCQGLFSCSSWSRWASAIVNTPSLSETST